MFVIKFFSKNSLFKMIQGFHVKVYVKYQILCSVYDNESVYRKETKSNWKNCHLGVCKSDLK